MKLIETTKLKKAALAWIKAGGPDTGVEADRLSAHTKRAHQRALKHVGNRRRVQPTKKRGNVKLTRRPLKTLASSKTEARERRKPGSVKWPAAHGQMGRDPSRRLLPGEHEMLSNQQLGHRSHQQRISREHLRRVTFSNGIKDIDVTTIESTDARAVRKARKTKRLTSSWKATFVSDKDGRRPYKGKQK
jgi:hypothetical protein